MEKNKNDKSNQAKTGQFSKNPANGNSKISNTDKSKIDGMKKTDDKKDKSSMDEIRKSKSKM
jgi:hypothetical protein